MKEWLYTAFIFVILAALLLGVVLFCSGCAAEEPSVTDSNGVPYGKFAMVEIGDGLWYDSSTWIVYWWNGLTMNCGRDLESLPSPYYAPNGIPYRYNPITNEFEEIER
jgi:hypothetical protein